MACQLGWTAALLAHSWFRQGDFLLLDRALSHGLGWDYLMRIDGGHLMAAGLAVIWALARISLYSWQPAAGVILVLVAAASLAMLRMLVTVFASDAGERTRRGILVPFGIYLFAPLAAGAVAWLSVAVRVLPFQLALFLAIDAHVRYLRRGRWPALIAAACWLALGMAAADQGALVPVLLFALTAAFGVPGQLRESARRAAVGYWRAWVVYGAVTAAYCVIFFLQLAGSGVPVPGPGTASSLYRFAATLLGTAALPGLAGGPWQWQPSGYGQAAPPLALEILSWLLVALVVAASCLLRPRAWRAWVLLLGWIVLADYAGPGLVARAGPRAVRIVTIFAACCFAAGAIASQQAFASATMAAAPRSYLATARAALAHAPRGTVVVDGATPGPVMNPAFFPPGTADTARVVGPLATRHGTAARVRWIPGLDGVYAAPMIFDAKGRLRPVTVTGLRSKAPPPAAENTAAPNTAAPNTAAPNTSGKNTSGKNTPACWNVTGAAISIPLGGPLYRWPWMVRLAYTGPAGRLSVRFGPGEASSVVLPAGSHLAYLPLTGSGNVVSARFTASSGGASLCVTRVVVGVVTPDPAGQAIPSHPVHE